ncbi:hypothetical protein BJV74DRAFT_839930 [Russula compacta]|nr:hypothetical protein BJV74DRAFT_839930 [Russula compacta]
MSRHIYVLLSVLGVAARRARRVVRARYLIYQLIRCIPIRAHIFDKYSTCSPRMCGGRSLRSGTPGQHSLEPTHIGHRDCNTMSYGE